jgi:hypothetical protein
MSNKETSMHRLTAVVVVAALAFAACGEDDSAPTTARATATPSAGDAERYCALTRAMDAAGEKFFAALERDKQATPQDYEAAERTFVERFAQEFETIEAAAPAQIRTDVGLLLAGQRRRAGLGGSVDEAQVGAAERRILRYERRNCGATG